MKSSEYYPIFLALLGILFFSMMDAVMKAQALAMGVFAATFWRAAMGALVASILYLPRRPTMAQGRVLKLHIMRAVLNAFMLCCLFFGLTRIPLAQAIGLTFIAPIIALFLAAPILGETIDKGAKFAAALGFGGVTIMVGGDVLLLDVQADILGVVAILLFAVMYAVYLVLQRMQALVAKPLEIAFYQNFIMLLVLSLGLPFAGSLPANAVQWTGALAAGLLAVGSLILMSMAYRKVEAQRLFAVEYTAFIWAAILGWLIFEESVSTQTLLGTALIILGCVVTARSPVR